MHRPLLCRRLLSSQTGRSTPWPRRSSATTPSSQRCQSASWCFRATAHLGSPIWRRSARLGLETRSCFAAFAMLPDCATVMTVFKCCNFTVDDPLSPHHGDPFLRSYSLIGKYGLPAGARRRNLLVEITQRSGDRRRRRKMMSEEEIAEQVVAPATQTARGSTGLGAFAEPLFGGGA
jgi:hypothetical protein